ncbi:MAG: leucine-rich repeat domain-containing protein [Oscillospiraceae bacterium]|nr:leucine-rich repeat domain-containing protein [Oscillospiraceae bacterium]
MSHWKRTAAGVLAAAILCSALPANAPVRDFFSGVVQTAHAAEVLRSGYCGNRYENGGKNVTWSLDDEGTLTVSGSGIMADYTSFSLPYTPPWYAYGSKIKRIVVDHGVTSIGEAAFYNCINLTSVTIPDSVTSIVQYAFSSCGSLTSVVIPESVTSIEDYAFQQCRSLDSVILEGDAPPALGESVFSGTNNDLKLIVPAAAVENYKAKMSAYADRIVPYTIGEWNCGAEGGHCKASLNAFGTLTVSGTGAMANWNGDLPWADYTSDIQTVVIEDGLTSIGASAFYDCSNLTSVTIPESVTSIGMSAFYQCSGLTSVIIPDSAESIGEAAFYGCSSLTSVTVPDGVANIEKLVFSECTGLTSVTLPNSMTSIGEYAFYGCTGLTSVTVPGSVTSIGANAFRSCTDLASLILESEIPPAFGRDALLYAHHDLQIYVPAAAVDDYKQDAGWRKSSNRIRSSTRGEWECGAAGNHCKAALNINGTLTVSGTGAMADWNSDAPWSDYTSDIIKVVIEEGVTSIGVCAFYHCSSLTAVIIPESVTDIGGDAFSGTAWLKARQEENPFVIVNGILIDASACSGEVTVPEGVKSIGEAAFEVCKDLTAVTIPESVTSIGPYAFLMCRCLDSVILEGDTPPVLGDDAFFFTHNNLKIYVPAAAGDAYREQWSDCAERIIANQRLKNEYAVLKEEDYYPVISGGSNQVCVRFSAEIPDSIELLDYGLIYYNSGNVIHTADLTLENVGICGIRKEKTWSANLTDNGCGVTAVGFVTLRNQYGIEWTQFTGELGGSFRAMTDAVKYVTLTPKANKAVISGGRNKVYAGFTANVPRGYTVEDYGLLYYNSGNVITTPYLTLENVGICGIKSAKYWSANITDNGFGAACVGFVKVRDAVGNVTVLYTEELGGSFSAISEAAAADAVTFTRQENKAVISGGKKKVFAGFSASVSEGYTVEDYGLIYYNSGTVITAPYLTLDNVGICGIKKAKYWSANITDIGCGVSCVGFVRVKDWNGYEAALYTEELGGSFASVSEEAAAKAVTLNRHANHAISTGSTEYVSVGFSANVPSGYTLEDYGLIYYNSGITAPELTLEKAGTLGIQKEKIWSARVIDHGYGVNSVGFVKVKDSNGYVTTLYTGELGAKFAELPH